MLRRIVLALAVSLLAAVLPLPLASAAPAVARLGGADRYETAVLISRDLYPTVGAQAPAPPPTTSPPTTAPLLAGGVDATAAVVALPPGGGGGGGGGGGPAPVDPGTTTTTTAPAGTVRVFPGTVYVASGEAFPDALAGGPAAATLGAPILLVRPRAVPDSTIEELRRLGPSQIVVLGGPAAISPEVFDRLAAYAPTVRRIGGADRYETAARITAERFAATGATVVVATGEAYPDALAGGATAARAGGPVLLTRRDSLPAATALELQRLAPARVVVAGGTVAVADAVLAQLRALAPSVERVWGADRYATALALAAEAPAAGTPGAVFVATGAAFPDALAGVPAAALASAPILLVRPDRAGPEAVERVRTIAAPRLVVLGGPLAVSAACVAELA